RGLGAFGQGQRLGAVIRETGCSPRWVVKRGSDAASARGSFDGVGPGVGELPVGPGAGGAVHRGSPHDIRDARAPVGATAQLNARRPGLDPECDRLHGGPGTGCALSVGRTGSAEQRRASWATSTVTASSICGTTRSGARTSAP